MIRLATRRRLLATVPVSAGVFGAAVAGCGVVPTEAPGVVSSEPVTAKVLTFNNPLFQNAKDDLVAVLADVDPTLRPDIIVFPGQIGAFREKMLALYGGGDIPDAQWIHPSITSLAGSRKLLRPLDELARRDRQTRLSDFYPGLLAYEQWKGATYALPWYSTGHVWMLNRDLFARLGVTPPDQLEKDGKWTWDTAVATLRSLTRGSQGDPTRTIGSERHSMNLDWACAWIWRNGGRVFSKDGKKCVLDQPAAVEAIQGLADLHNRYKVINNGPIRDDFPDGFYSGRIGISYAAKEATAPDRNQLSKATFPLGMVAVPKGKGGRVTRLGALGFGAATDGPNGDAGWRWTRFMAGPAAAAVLMRRRSTLPVRPQFTKLPEFGESMAPWESKEVWLESQAAARAMEWPANYDEIATLWSKTWNAILTQTGPVKSLIGDFVRQVDFVLAQDS